MNCVKKLLNYFKNKQKEKDEVIIRKIMFGMKVGLQDVNTREELRMRAEEIFAADNVII